MLKLMFWLVFWPIRLMWFITVLVLKLAFFPFSLFCGKKTKKQRTEDDAFFDGLMMGSILFDDER